MTLFWLFILSHVGVGEMTLETDVYRGPVPNQIVITDDGGVLIADPHEQRVRMFSPNGVLLRHFGERGAGPAQFRRVSAIHTDGQKLFVFDGILHKVEVFELNGKWKDSHKAPLAACMQGSGAQKTIHGWVWQTQDDALVLSSEDFKEHEALLGRYSPSKSLRELPDTSVFRPARDRLRFAVSLDGKTVVYYKSGNDFRLHVHNLATNTSKSFRLPYKRVKFSEEIGRDMFEDFKARKPNQKTSVVFPDYYPAVVALHMTPEGLVRVKPGSLNDALAPPVVFNFEGDIVDYAYKDVIVYRYLKRVGGWVYIAYKREDQVLVRRVSEQAFDDPTIQELIKP